MSASRSVSLWKPAKWEGNEGIWEICYKMSMISAWTYFNSKLLFLNFSKANTFFKSCSYGSGSLLGYLIRPLSECLRLIVSTLTLKIIRLRWWNHVFYCTIFFLVLFMILYFLGKANDVRNVKISLPTHMYEIRHHKYTHKYICSNWIRNN